MSGPHARSVVRSDHALIAPESHVPGPVPGWRGAEHVTLIGPPMGARFAMALVAMEPGAVAGPPAAGASRFVYVLRGELRLRADGAPGDGRLVRGSFAHLPPDAPHELSAAAASRACVIDKPYVLTPGAPAPAPRAGDAAAIASAPLLGDPAVRVSALLPEDPSLDLAVNLMAFDPGAALPFTETHAMEHGLLMLAGTMVYRLGDAWYPVAAGDAIWMGPFCPQWACCHGTEPAVYLLYKDWNRDVLA